MAPAPLPPALEDRLAAVADRVWRIGVIRGACRFVAAFLCSTVVLLLLDAVFQLSVTARCALQVGWLAVVGFLGWRLVARPWQADVPLVDVARRVEAHFPELGERLVSVVGLREEAEPANGSPSLIATLARDTEARTRELDFARAVPIRPAARLAAATGAAVLLTIAVAAAVPGTGSQLRRVALPWYRPAVVSPYEVVVTSGDPVIRRGDPVTLTMYLRPTEPSAVLPDAATLVLRESSGPGERRLSMTGDAAAAFHATLPVVADDFEYRVEAGAAASGWHTVGIADPVDLTDQCTAEIVPPAYATGIAPKSVAGFTDLNGLQCSAVTLRLRFNRPADSAVLEWRPEARPASETADLIPVNLAPDRTGGDATFPLIGNGVLRVVLTNDPGPRKYRTETSIAVRVTVDAPPRFEQVSGVSAQPYTVRPGERVQVSFVAVDDIGIGAAELEYATGPEPAKSIRIPIPLTGADTPHAEGTLPFDLTGKGREGDTIRYRVRVADNRRVEDAKLGPQKAVYPPAGWGELRLSESAPPLDRQEIFGQRDAIRNALTAALQKVKAAQTETETLRADTAGRSPLPVDHAVRLNAVRGRTGKASSLLRDTARDAALTPELRPLAASVRDVADRPLGDADDAIRKAVTDNPTDRRAALGTALAQMTDAAGRIEELLRQNDRLARDRLDRRRLGALAADQGDLAEQVGTTPSDDLLKMQRELRDRLNTLLAESDPLKRGIGAAAGREAAKLAAEAKALAGLGHDLAAASDRLSAGVRRGLLDRLVRAQAATADRAAGVLARIDTAARVAGLTVPLADDFRHAADLLAGDKIVEALTDLERLAQALDRTAAEFDRWAAERTDPKLAARQLARWQADLRDRFTAATKETPFEKLADPVKAALRVEQTVLLRSTERLKFPPDTEIASLRDAAFVHLRMAAKRLETDGAGAEPAMKNAAESLARLADKAPSAADRLARTRPEIDQLRLEQDTILAAAEQVIRHYEKQGPTAAVIQALAQKFAPIQAQQVKLADRLAALDLPGLEPRQARAVRAVGAAAADLKAGLPYDSAASLAWAKRELDRLRQAADNSPPADNQAQGLADKQTTVAKMLAELGAAPTPRQLGPAVALQAEVSRLLGALPAPESPVLLHEAKEAVGLADVAFHNGSKPDAILRQVRAAAEALNALSDQMNGREPARDRVKRLAANRRQAECDAKKLAGRPYNPDASGEAKRQLGREAEEIVHLRVGAAGQAAKKKVLNLYTRLQARDEPDRQVVDQKQLAAALAELAAAMTDTAELTTKPDAAGPPESDPSDAFLPSKVSATTLRDIARQERALRERANAVAAEVTKRIKPAETNPLAALETRQRAITAAVAASLAGKAVPANEAAQAADAARLAADWLAVGEVRPAREAGEAAARRLRQLAGEKQPWGKTAAELAARQEAILGELAGLPDDPAIAAVQQKVRHEALAKNAVVLAHRLDTASKDATPGGSSAKMLADAADLARRAKTLLANAAKKSADGMPADAAKLRTEAEKILRQAAERATEAAGPLPPTSIDPVELAVGAAVREAELAMRRAAGELGPKGDPVAAEKAMRQAAGALDRAAKADERKD